MELAYDDIVLDEGLGPWFGWSIALSLILHAVLFYFVFFVMPGLSSVPRKLPPIYTVNLVTLPPASAGKPAPVQPKPVAKPKPAPALEKARLVPLGPIKPKEPAKPEVKKIKKPLPEPKPAPKVDSGKALNQALTRIKSKVRRKRKVEHSIDDAIARLAERQTATVGTGTRTGTRGTGPVSELDSRMRDYYLVIYNIISTNWNMPPESITGPNKNLEAVYIIQVNPDGKIMKAWFERKSGQKYFDQSAVKAVRRSDPLPSLPKVFKGREIEIGLRFTPLGIKRSR